MNIVYILSVLFSYFISFSKLVFLLPANYSIAASENVVDASAEEDVGVNRKRRWSELNAILDKKSKSKPKNAGEETTISYSNVSWNDIKRVYDNITAQTVIPSKSIPGDIFLALKTYLTMVNSSMKDLSGKEAKRMFYIVPIVVGVCHCFDGQVEILIEDDIDGQRIHANGHFEIILKKGDKRVCIVEAKKDDMDQGRAQCLLGCEAVSDIERKSVVYGIVTTYQNWDLTISTDEGVIRDEISVTVENGMMTDEALRLITGKIYLLLSNEALPQFN